MGSMEEGSGKGQKASTHIPGLVVVDVAGVKVDCATIDEYTTTLPNKEGARIQSVPGKYLHGVDGRRFRESAEGERVHSVGRVNCDHTRELSRACMRSILGSFFHGVHGRSFREMAEVECVPPAGRKSQIAITRELRHACIR